MRAAEGPIMTVTAFKDKFALAKKGDWITYYTGFILADRAPSLKVHSATDCSNLAKLSDAVYDIYQIGKARLLQRRLGENKYEYIAVKR
jgi:hypothetical protein